MRVVLADDERPARRFLANLLKTFEGVEIVGEGASGREAVALIERLEPDLVLLDMSMPELDGLSVARLVNGTTAPSIAFVTAYDEFAIEAFELNAIDYLLKPVERARLALTLERARTRITATETERTEDLRTATETVALARPRYLERIPIRRKEETVMLPVRQLASIVADGEMLHLTTVGNNRFVISFRLHALESRLDPRRFVRISRGAIVAIDAIERIHAMPGGLCEIRLHNGQALAASRIQSRTLRDTLLRI